MCLSFSYQIHIEYYCIHKRLLKLLNEICTQLGAHSHFQLLKHYHFSEKNLYINEESLEINSSRVSLKKIIPSSGLIIKNDPSIPFIYFSFILIIFGTIISLIPTNQLWILVNKESQKLSIGGLSNKNLVGFKKEFFKLSDEIKNF